MKLWEAAGNQPCPYAIVEALDQQKGGTTFMSDIYRCLPSLIIIYMMWMGFKFHHCTVTIEFVNLLVFGKSAEFLADCLA